MKNKAKKRLQYTLDAIKSVIKLEPRKVKKLEAVMCVNSAFLGAE